MIKRSCHIRWSSFDAWCVTLGGVRPGAGCAVRVGAFGGAVADEGGRERQKAVLVICTYPGVVCNTAQCTRCVRSNYVMSSHAYVHQET